MKTARELLANIRKGQTVINPTTEAYDALEVLFREIAINLKLFGNIQYTRERITDLIAFYASTRHLPKEDKLAVHNALFGNL